MNKLCSKYTLKSDRAILKARKNSVERSRSTAMSYVIMRLKKLKTRASVASSGRHTFRERDTPNADKTLTCKNTHEKARDTNGNEFAYWNDFSFTQNHLKFIPG